MALTLTSVKGDFKAWKVLITAKLAGVEVAEDNSATADDSSVHTLPVLATPNGVISQSNAIARYIARSRPEAGLFGSSFFESAEVDSWIEWSTNNLELPAILSTYWQFEFIKFDFQANKKAVNDLLAGLAQLNDHLLSRTYMVGNRLSLADIVLFAQLVYPFRMTLPDLSAFTAVTRWFSHIAAQPAVAATVGAVTFCKVAPKAPKTEKKKKKKKPAQQAKAPAPAPAKRKPKNPLDALPKSPLNLEEWKRQYSNSTSDYYKSMEWFWANWDPEGWSIWFQSFNHNEENTRNFIVSNKLEGFVQRTIAIQKYAFGCMQMLDTSGEKGYYTVNGVWLIRGQDIKPMDCNPEVGVYTWSKMDASDPAVRKQIADYWCGEEIDGYVCEDAKVFK